MKQFYWIMSLLILLAACAKSSGGLPDVNALPTGNAERGAKLFDMRIRGAPSCTSCHSLTDAVVVGPGFAGYSERAGIQVEGLSAQAYTYDSILQPANHLVSGFSNLMYPQYANKLTAQQLADMIAYLLTL